MKRFKRFLVLLALLATPSLLHAQDIAHLAFAYDLDAAAFVYPKLSGRGGDTYTGGIMGTGRIKTTGSTTTVDAVDAALDSFSRLAVGDVITVRRTETSSVSTVDRRVVTAKASDDQITVDTAVNWDRTAGFQWEWYDFSDGTTDADGWVDISRFSIDTKFIIQYEQGDFATGFQYRIECETQTLDPKPNVVFPGETSDCGPNGTLVTGTCQHATAGLTGRVEVLLGDNVGNRCRVGIRRNGADTSDAGAAVERISISVTGRKES